MITGYTATVDPERLGLRVLAFVRLRYPSGNYQPLPKLLDETPEIIEAHHVTGEGCFVLKAVARSMRHLEEVTGRLATLGPVTSNIVYSSPLPRRDLTAQTASPPTG
ncbi:MAG: Lrp/AsnC family transcriptional regulator [Micromonosporaceae bacterium]